LVQSKNINKRLSPIFISGAEEVSSSTMPSKAGQTFLASAVKIHAKESLHYRQTSHSLNYNIEYYIGDGR